MTEKLNMSDVGGKEAKKNGEKRSTEGRRAVADEFARAISKVAVSQICEGVGFHGVSDSALVALADIAVRYLKDLGRTSSFYASLANRTECNVFDIVQGLEDLGSSTGFSGGPEISSCLTDSGTLKEIIEYVGTAEEIPFAQPVPQFPVVRSRRGIPSFVQMGETPVFKHVPEWLPAFPDPHTYIHTPVWNERVSDSRSDKIELARQKRKAESSLLSLQQRLLSCDSAAATTSRSEETNYSVFAKASTSAAMAGGGVKSAIAGSDNPFLAKPREDGEKDVDSIVLLDKPSTEAIVENHVSLVEMFAPAIEAVNVRFSESGDIVQKNLPDKRTAIQLNFKLGRKLIGEPTDLRLWIKGSGRTGSASGRDDEKDDKKRRVELILKQSTENRQELMQL